MLAFIVWAGGLTRGPTPFSTCGGHHLVPVETSTPPSPSTWPASPPAATGFLALEKAGRTVIAWGMNSSFGSLTLLRCLVVLFAIASGVALRAAGADVGPIPNALTSDPTEV